MADFKSVAEARKARLAAEKAEQELLEASATRLEELTKEINEIVDVIKEVGDQDLIEKAKTALSGLPDFKVRNLLDHEKRTAVADAFAKLTPTDDGYPRVDVMREIRRITGRPTMALATMEKFILEVADNHGVQVEPVGDGDPYTKWYYVLK